jgi:hypothetical protein
MILSAHQPQFLPWLGYFDKIAKADVFILMDDVQYKKNEWQNRNKIKTAQGPHWLTVPVHYDFGQLIKQIKLNEEDPWRKKNLRTWEQSYAKTPHFLLYKKFMESLHARPWENLADINSQCVREVCGFLNIKTKMVSSSDVPVEGKSTERLVNLCKALKADVYFSGAGGRDYLDLSLFEQAGIRVEFQTYHHPVYPQVHGDFVSHLAIIDLLCNCGPASADILSSGSKPS